MKKNIIFITSFIFLILGFEFFFKSGFYVFLDTIFTPVYSLSNIFDKTLYFHIHDIFSMILGYELYSKIFMVVVLITGSLLGLYIARYIIESFEIKNKTLKTLTGFLGIVFILSNPFIYERLVSQVGIAFGIFFVGFGIVSLLFYLKNNSDKNIYLSSLYFAIALTIFPHTIVFIILIGILFSIFFYKTLSIKKIAVAFLIFLGININWIAGSIFGGNYNPIDTTQTFNELNIEVFKQNSIGNIGVELTTLQLYGFWGELGNRIITPDRVNEKWFIAGFMILFIIVIGGYYFFKKDKRLTIFLILLAIISYILSLGIASGLFKSFNSFLFENVPYYIGMREPAKLLGIVMLVYSLFLLVGFIYIFELFNKLQKKYSFELNKYIFNIYTYFALILIFIFAWNPNMFGGFNGQLKIINYPDEYLESRSFLIENNYDTNLVLPWHSYMGCAWNHGRVISNPFPSIIKLTNTIRADNIEIGPLYTNYDNPVSIQIESFLREKDISILRELEIDTILFQKNCGTFLNYDFLYDLENLELISESDHLDIFKIKY